MEEEKNAGSAEALHEALKEPSPSPSRNQPSSDHLPLKQKVEALLFASGKPMKVDQLSSLTGADIGELNQALAQLKQEYDERGSALTFFEENGAWKMNVREAYLSLVQQIVADTELAMPIMETLAVIAYQKNPLQADVVKIRGSGAYEHIAELVKFGFVTKVPEGRSYRLKLSEKFYEYFDIEDQADVDKFFEDVKKPEPPPPQEEASPLPEPAQVKQALEKIEISPEQKKEQEVFLQEIEQKIASVREKNDELERDALFEREKVLPAGSEEANPPEQEGVKLEEGAEQKEASIFTGEPTLLEPLSKDVEEEIEAEEERLTKEQQQTETEDDAILPEAAPLVVPQSDGAGEEDAKKEANVGTVTKHEGAQGAESKQERGKDES